MRIDWQGYWYTSRLNALTIVLLPFSWLFGVGAAMRRFLYRRGIKKTRQFAVPVIVVGNITVGGTGKTPFVIWLAHLLQAQGYHPGIISRGVGGQLFRVPYVVQPNDLPKKVGDEAILFLENTHCPVVVSVDRVAAAAYLQEYTACNIIISDDGLQHYRLGRDLEIVLVDGVRRFGNQQLLPAGPLREPVRRLKQASMVVIQDGESHESTMMLEPIYFISLQDCQQKIAIQDSIKTFSPCHAVAGIGHPNRFFMRLKALGLQIIPHAFPDHYLYRAKDLDFKDNLPLIMTEKDAVKCRGFANEHYWYLQVAAKMSVGIEKQLLVALTNLRTV